MISITSKQWRRQVSEFGGAFEGQHAFWGGKIEFHEISPPPRCQNFWPPGFFFIHFFRNFFPDISNFFPDLSKLSRPTKIFHGPTKNFPQTYQNVIFLAAFHKFLQFCLSNSDFSTTFGHFSQKSPLCGVPYSHGRPFVASRYRSISFRMYGNWNICTGTNTFKHAEFKSEKFPQRRPAVFAQTAILSSQILWQIFHCATTRMNEDTRLCYSKGPISINQSSL